MGEDRRKDLDMRSSINKDISYAKGTSPKHDTFGSDGLSPGYACRNAAHKESQSDGNAANLAALEAKVESFFEQPPCDNDHVAEGCEKFAEPVIETSEQHMQQLKEV